MGLKVGDRVEITGALDPTVPPGQVRPGGYISAGRGVVVALHGFNRHPLILVDGSEITQSVREIHLRVLDVVDLIGEL
jgi:hypothetical protein